MTKPSLRDDVLVSQESAQLECFSRDGQSETWQFREVSDRDAVLHPTSTACALRVREIHSKVDLTVPHDMDRD